MGAKRLAAKRRAAKRLAAKRLAAKRLAAKQKASLSVSAINHMERVIEGKQSVPAKEEEDEADEAEDEEDADDVQDIVETSTETKVMTPQARKEVAAAATPDDAEEDFFAETERKEAEAERKEAEAEHKREEAEHQKAQALKAKALKKKASLAKQHQHKEKKLSTVEEMRQMLKGSILNALNEIDHKHSH